MRKGRYTPETLSILKAKYSFFNNLNTSVFCARSIVLTVLQFSDYFGLRSLRLFVWVLGRVSVLVYIVDVLG